jgi:hypothetical protein
MPADRPITLELALDNSFETSSHYLCADPLGPPAVLRIAKRQRDEARAFS